MSLHCFAWWKYTQKSCFYTFTLQKILSQRQHRSLHICKSYFYEGAKIFWSVWRVSFLLVYISSNLAVIRGLEITGTPVHLLQECLKSKFLENSESWHAFASLTRSMFVHKIRHNEHFNYLRIRFTANDDLCFGWGSYNKLPIDVVDAASEEILKLRLDGVWDILFVP